MGRGEVCRGCPALVLGASVDLLGLASLLLLGDW